MNVKNILNGAALVLGIAGVVFKGQHWAGANMLLLVGLLLLLVSVLAFTVGPNTEVGVPAPLNYLMVITLAVAVVAAMFKTMHWQGSPLMAVIAGTLTIVLSLMFLFSKVATVSRQFVTTLVVYLALIMAVLNMARMNNPPTPEVVAAATEAAN